MRSVTQNDLTTYCKLQYDINLIDERTQTVLAGGLSIIHFKLIIL